MSSVEKIGKIEISGQIHKNYKPVGNGDPAVSFSKVLKNESISDKLEASFQNIEKLWNDSEKQSSKLIKSIPENYRVIFEAQKIVSKCNFQTEFATKIADAASSSVKKLSQQNN